MMATLTIRNVPENVKSALQDRATAHGRSMEAELRKLVESYASPATGRDLAKFVRCLPSSLTSDEDANALAHSLDQAHATEISQRKTVSFDE